MNTKLCACVAAVICLTLASIASALQPGYLGYFKARDAQRQPIQNVFVNDDGAPVLGGDLPLQFRRLSSAEDPAQKRGTLVVQFKGRDGNLEDRFLAYPLDVNSSTHLRVVAVKGLDTIWTISRWEEKKSLGKRPGIGGRSRPAEVIRVKWEEFFAVSDGPLKGQALCADEHKSLVLIDPATLRRSPAKARIGTVLEFTYDDDPNDGK